MGAQVSHVEQGCCDLVLARYGRDILYNPSMIGRLPLDFSPQEEYAAYHSVTPERTNRDHFSIPTRRKLASVVLQEPEQRPIWAVTESSRRLIDQEKITEFPALAADIASGTRMVLTDGFVPEIKQQYSELKQILDEAAKKYLDWLKNPVDQAVHLLEFHNWMQQTFPHFTPTERALLLRREATPFEIRHHTKWAVKNVPDLHLEVSHIPPPPSPDSRLNQINFSPKVLEIAEAIINIDGTNIPTRSEIARVLSEKRRGSVDFTPADLAMVSWGLKGIIDRLTRADKRPDLAGQTIGEFFSYAGSLPRFAGKSPKEILQYLESIVNNRQSRGPRGVESQSDSSEKVDPYLEILPLLEQGKVFEIIPQEGESITDVYSRLQQEARRRRLPVMLLIDPRSGTVHVQSSK